MISAFKVELIAKMIYLYFSTVYPHNRKPAGIECYGTYLHEFSKHENVLLHNWCFHHHHHLSVHLSMLLTGIIIHGYIPDYLLMGTIISLPKDKHGNICSADNYRGISL